MLNKKYLLESLEDGVVRVDFQKIDNTNRIMECTKDESRIPSYYHAGGKTKRVEKDDDVIRVFDMELEEWRSFHFSRLNSFEVLNQPPSELGLVIGDGEELEQLYWKLTDISDKLIDQVDLVTSEIREIADKIYDLRNLGK